MLDGLQYICRAKQLQKLVELALALRRVIAVNCVRYTAVQVVSQNTYIQSLECGFDLLRCPNNLDAIRPIRRKLLDRLHILFHVFEMVEASDHEGVALLVAIMKPSAWGTPPPHL